MVTSAPSTSRAEPFLDEAKSLACVHCGLCLGACPTYLETGNENDSPRGRIYLMRALQDGRMPLEEEAVRHIDLCLGCRACESACPSGVAYGALLESTREHIERYYPRRWLDSILRRLLIAQVFPFPERLELMLAPARWAKRRRLERFLPTRLRDMLSMVPLESPAADLPTFAPSATQPARGRVGFISGCVMDVMFQNTNRSTVALLNRAGYDVVIPSGQSCCGALDAHGGNLERARRFARRTIQTFAAHPLDAVIINAAGCGSTLKEYGHLLEGDPMWAEQARGFAARVKDISEWLADSGLELRRAADGLLGPVTYHDACHLAHPQGITKSPRELVQRVAGDRYVELPEADVCCGSAGSYNLTEPEMAARLQRRKTAHVLETGAKVVVTTNPGCLLQIRAGLERAGEEPIQVMHLSDFLLRYGTELANPNERWDEPHCR